MLSEGGCPGDRCRLGCGLLPGNKGCLIPQTKRRKRQKDIFTCGYNLLHTWTTTGQTSRSSMPPLNMWVLVAVCVMGALGQLEDQKPPDLAVEPPGAPAALHPGYGQESHEAKDNAKLGVFIAAAVGTVALMGVVYCIYNQFYTKHPYLHTELNDDTDVTLDLRGPYSPSRSPSLSSVFPGRASRMERGLGRGSEHWRARGGGREGYGALSDTPSIITLPPSLSPPPSASSRYPTLTVAPPSPLKTISAQDLEKSFL